MRVKCIKADCQVCGVNSTVQIFFKANGQVSYGRSRHYLGKSDGKPMFEYHSQTTEFLEKKLRELGITYDAVGHDLEKPNLAFNTENQLSTGLKMVPSKLRVEGSNPSPPV